MEGKNKKKKAPAFVVVGVMLILLVFLYVFLPQYRHFYKAGDVTFTFWKTGQGCYIMPYKYFGLSIPKNDYMIAPNLQGVVIFVGDDSTLYVFPAFTAYGLEPTIIEINLSSFKYKYFPYSGREEYDLIDYYKNKGYPYVNVFINEMYHGDLP